MSTSPQVSSHLLWLHLYRHQPDTRGLSWLEGAAVWNSIILWNTQHEERRERTHWQPVLIILSRPDFCCFILPSFFVSRSPVQSRSYLVTFFSVVLIVFLNYCFKNLWVDVFPPWLREYCVFCLFCGVSYQPRAALKKVEEVNWSAMQPRRNQRSLVNFVYCRERGLTATLV